MMATIRYGGACTFRVSVYRPLVSLYHARAEVMSTGLVSTRRWLHVITYHSTPYWEGVVHQATWRGGMGVKYGCMRVTIGPVK